MKFSFLGACGVTSIVITLNVVSASTTTIGLNGIRSAGLHTVTGLPLNGLGVRIGQLEERRPSDPEVDDDEDLLNSFVNPSEVFFRQTTPPTIPTPPPAFDPTADDQLEIDVHAIWVAGIMISTDNTDPDMDGDSPIGVAPGVSLFSAGYNNIEPFLSSDERVSITAQHLVFGRDVKAMNMSFAIAQTTSTLNGNQLLTLFVDWSARHHNVLYVIAGNEAEETDAVPTDNFNGMTVAASDKVDGVYRSVATLNRYDQDAEGEERASISILAPGVGVKVTGLNEATEFRNGTSYAAPHVTATAALLQQYASERIMNAGSSQWGENARQHEVMKAVMMNSADKLIDDGTVEVNGNEVPQGGLLGMTRTVIKQDGTSTWLGSIAYDDSLEGIGQFYPLDEEMGAGHLNAARALQQFAPGEYNSDSGDVPTIGWDYGMTSGAMDRNEYPLAGTLQAEHFISITLASDRQVSFQSDADMDGEYDVGDTFKQSTATLPNPDNDDLINNLDLFLLPKNAFSINQAVAQSVSIEGTLQHIFFQIPETGEYEIWVRQFDAEMGLTTGQTYALAWWYGLAPPLGSTLPGDYNGDTIINEEDYEFWTANYGQEVDPGTGADGSENGVVDVLDYITWRMAFESAGSGSGSSAVPEPSGGLLLATGLAISLAAIRRRRQQETR